MIRKITIAVFILVFLLLSYPLFLSIYQNIFLFDSSFADLISALSVFLIISLYLLSMNSSKGNKNSKASIEREAEELKEEIQTYLESENLEKLNVNTPVSLTFLLEETLNLNFFSPIIQKRISWFLNQLAAYETTIIDAPEFESNIYAYQKFLEQH